VLADTLASLMLLGGDGEVMAAAILHVAPDWREKLEPKLLRDHSAVAALLEGQRAANQVWALHAEHAGGGNTEGLRRLLLAIIRDKDTHVTT
jgi:GTP pyrophosphokinase